MSKINKILVSCKIATDRNQLTTDRNQLTTRNSQLTTDNLECLEGDSTFLFGVPGIYRSYLKHHTDGNTDGTRVNTNGK